MPRSFSMVMMGRFVMMSSEQRGFFRIFCMFKTPSSKGWPKPDHDTPKSASLAQPSWWHSFRHFAFNITVSDLADADERTFFAPIRQCNGPIVYKIGDLLGSQESRNLEYACCMTHGFQNGLQ